MSNQFHDDAGISSCVLEDDNRNEVAIWRRRTAYVACGLIGALILLAFRLVEIEAGLRAAARV